MEITKKQRVTTNKHLDRKWTEKGETRLALIRFQNSRTGLFSLNSKLSAKA